MLAEPPLSRASSHRGLAVCLYFELGADSEVEGRLALQHRISHMSIFTQLKQQSD
jgi:hypothetical protein